MVGYANEVKEYRSYWNTQRYNCHKLLEYGVGAVLDLSKEEEPVVTPTGKGLNNDSSLSAFISSLAKKGRVKTLVDESQKKIAFYKALLAEERENMLDIEYWIEYVNKFDVGHTIPLYENLGYVY